MRDGKFHVAANDMATIRKVSSDLNADIIAYTGGIEFPYDCALVTRIRDLTRHRPNVLLIMTTGGGSADAAYRMMRLVQHFYTNGKIYFLVVDQCKSAGTLMAIGANEIIMVDDAELGPLDVQVMKPDELFEYTSGLTAYQALTALRNETFQSFEDHFLRLRRYSGFQITTRTAAGIAAKLATGGVQKLYEQLDPMRIAEHQRAMMIAEEYGNRLNRGNLKEESLDRLIADYPSHGFMIDFAEARTLFARVRLARPDEQKLCVLLLKLRICVEEEPLPKILIITEDIVTAVADKPSGKKDEKKIRKTSKARKASGRHRVSTDRKGDAKLDGASRGVEGNGQ